LPSIEANVDKNEESFFSSSIILPPIFITYSLPLSPKGGFLSLLTVCLIASITFFLFLKIS